MQILTPTNILLVTFFAVCVVIFLGIVAEAASKQRSRREARIQFDLKLAAQAKRNDELTLAYSKRRQDRLRQAIERERAELKR